MVPHEMPATPDAVGAGDSSEPAVRDDTAATSAPAARFAISRGQLFMLLAILLPAVASMLAPIFSGDVAYQIRAGQLMFESGALVNTDPFTFTVVGEPWLNQQWGAGVALALGFDVGSWAGLLLLRAVLIGLTFGLVYAACRGSGATAIVSSLVTLGAFVVAASNLALRSQTFGLLFFAAIVTLLVYRRKHPWLLALIPLIALAWANMHGSFFIGWAAIGFAALEDIASRSRIAIVTVGVGLLAVAITLLNPWGVAMWQYVVDLTSNSLISLLISEWQATTLGSPTGIFFFASVALVLLMLLIGGRTISWLQLAWLAALALIGLMAVRGVAWWAIGAAPLAAMLASDLALRGHQLSDAGPDRQRGLGYTAIAGSLMVLALVALPFWRPVDAVYGPEGVLRDAPRGVTQVLLAEATPQDRLFAELKWSSWFEMVVPGVPVMVDLRIELYDRAIWGDYLHVHGGRADWQEILDRWQVSLVAIAADEGSQLMPFLDTSDAWTLRYQDTEGSVFRRVQPEG